MVRLLLLVASITIGVSSELCDMDMASGEWVENADVSDCLSLQDDGSTANTTCQLTCKAGFEGFNAPKYQNSISVHCPKGNFAPVNSDDVTWECQQFACNTTTFDDVANADLSACTEVQDGGRCTVDCIPGYIAVSTRRKTTAIA